MIPQKTEESKTLALLERVRKLKAEGKDIVSFAAGESDFSTPAVVVEKAYEAMKKGNTRYVSTLGIESLREAIAQDYRERLGAKWVTKDNVLMVAGAKQGLFLVLDALLNPADEVLIPKPYWVSYPGIVKAVGGKSVFVEGSSQDGFFPTVESLDKAKTPQTKALIFASPCNPTGSMITKSHLEAIVSWCVKNKVTLIYDELYERLVLDDSKTHVSALALIDHTASEYVVSVNAFSKTLAMTGWRVGYVVTHSQNIKALAPLQGQMLTCIPGFLQEACIEGLKNGNEIIKPVVAAFKSRLKILTEGLDKIPSLSYMRPSGAFYLFVNVEKVIKQKGYPDDLACAAALIDEALIATVDGTSMGMPGWLRFSFATSETEIKKGLERLAKFCA